MSHSNGKHKLLLMEQLETLGCKTEKPQESCGEGIHSSENKLNWDINTSEKCKEEISEKILRSLGKMINMTIHESGCINQCHDIFDSKDMEKDHFAPSSAGNRSDVFDVIKSAEKPSKSLIDDANQARKFLALLSDACLGEKFGSLAKRVIKQPQDSKTMWEKCTGTELPLEDSNKFVDRDNEETPVKGLLLDQSFESISNTHTPSVVLCKDAVVYQEEALVKVLENTVEGNEKFLKYRPYDSIATKALEIGENLEIVALDETLSKLPSRTEAGKEKGEQDANEPEKSKMFRILDDDDDDTGGLLSDAFLTESLSDTISFELTEKFKDEQENMEKENHAEKNNQATFSEESESSIEVVRDIESFSICKSHLEGCGEGFPKLRYPTNHLSFESFIDGQHICFQNNIYHDTLHINPESVSFCLSSCPNIFKKSLSKCESKRIFVDSYVSNSLNFLPSSVFIDSANLKLASRPACLEKEAKTDSLEVVVNEDLEPDDIAKDSSTFSPERDLEKSGVVRAGHSKGAIEEHPLQASIDGQLCEVQRAHILSRKEGVRHNAMRKGQGSAKWPEGGEGQCNRRLGEPQPKQPPSNRKSHSSFQNLETKSKRPPEAYAKALLKKERKKHSNSSKRVAGKRSKKRKHNRREGQETSKNVQLSKKEDLPSSQRPIHLGQEGGKFRACSGRGGGAASNKGGTGGGGNSGEPLRGSPGGIQSSQGSSQGSGSGGDDDHSNDDNNRKKRMEDVANNSSSSNNKTRDENKNKKGTDSQSNNVSQAPTANSSTNCYNDDRRNYHEGPQRDDSYTLPKPHWDALTIRKRQLKEKQVQEVCLPSQLMYECLPPSHPAPLASADSCHKNRDSKDLEGHASEVETAYDDCTTAGSIPGSAPLPVNADLADTGRVGREHAVISPIELCEIIGSATLNVAAPSEAFHKFNICLTKAMHDLTFGGQEEMGEGPHQQTEEMSAGPGFTPSEISSYSANSSTIPNQPKVIDQSAAAMDQRVDCPSVCSPLDCHVCLVVSSLLMHLSQDTLGHHYQQHQNIMSGCPQCGQILSLMTQHARTCVTLGRPRNRITSADLCYKICKKAGWCAEEISCDAAHFSGKIQKYCDKVLRKSMKGPDSSNDLDMDPLLGLGEIDSLPVSTGDMNSSGTPHLSSCGNPVVVETGGPGTSDRQPSLSPGKDPDRFGSITVATTPAISNPTDSSSLTSSELTCTSSTPLGRAATVTVSATPFTSATVSSKVQRGLVRKGSQKTPAIPQPIVEEGAGTSEGGQVSQDDMAIRDLIYKKYGPKGTDPYDTQPTFGDKKGYESMPQGIPHDQEQFFSFRNRAEGVPGIGEVVFGNHKQLRLVAGFWAKKRDDCERRRTSPPYQHREEGVILSQYKEHFSILLTRYQKHHQWERVSHLGSGMSGKCHLVMDLKTDFKFCCKKVHLLKYTEEEVKLWSEINHPYIVKLYGALRHGVKIYIFCEFIDGDSLAECIKEQKHLGQRFSHWSAINYFHQLLKVLSYLQSKNILHEDIKADNILMRKGSTFIAVTDFGTSRRLCDPVELKHKSPVGSPAHWSPEKAASEGHGFPSDLWAAVCVLIHMLSGDPPWMRRFMKSATILNFIIYSREPPLEDVPSNVQPMVRDLIASGLVKDADNRPSPNQLLCHDAFKILENVKPDRYYSSLVSLTRAAPLSRPNEPEKTTQDEQGSANNECKELYSKEISISGPFQESDSRADSQNTESDNNDENAVEENGESGTGQDASAELGDGQDAEESPILSSVKEIKVEHEEQITGGSTAENIPTRLNEALTLPKSHTDASAVIPALPASLNEASRQTPVMPERCTNVSEGVSATMAPQSINSSQGARPKERRALPHDRELLQIPDLNALLSDLLKPNESKAFAFYNDEVPNSTEALNQSSVKQRQLKVFVPQERELDPLPNLSIFALPMSDGGKSHASSGETTIRPHSLLVPANHQESSSTKGADGSAEEGQQQLQPAVSSQHRHAEMSTAISFVLSSGSEDYPSADLFDSGSTAGRETIRTMVAESQAAEMSQVALGNTQGEKESKATCMNIPPQSLQSESNISESLSPGSSHHTNLQQRKPNHLKLSMSPTALGPSSLPTSAAEGSSGSSSSSHGAQGQQQQQQMCVGKRQLDVSWLGGQVTNKTPSTGRLSATSSSRMSSSTSASHANGSPWFKAGSSSSSVYEEQERMMQMLKEEQISLSSSGSERFNDTQGEESLPSEATNVLDREDPDLQLVLSKLQENIDSNALEGQWLQLYDEMSMRVVLTTRFMDGPVYKKKLVESISKRMTRAYGHFTLRHMDRSPLRLDVPLEANQLLVSCIPEPQQTCLCESCISQF